jgi:hypothetical protein
MKSKRRPDFKSKSTDRTLALQAQVAEWLELFSEGMTVSELASALGISRQLCLYHAKKLAAARGVVMTLEPCLENGGLRYRVWSDAAIMGHYVRRFYAPRAAEVKRAA